MSKDLIKIKKKYGENMMHLCRELFPTILEEDGMLFELFSYSFEYSRDLYDDVINNSLENNLKNFIYSKLKLIKNYEESNKTPYELLSDAGYYLYECKNENDIQYFKKYYANNEALCSFKGGRLDTCYVFFAVKKNVDEIKREYFTNPMRQDLYGTSVISIQFTRGAVNTLSIKNRYNHTIKDMNPDATFSNNLENIIPGLTRSFEKYFNLNINQNDVGYFEIPGYVRASDGKYYKYNYEINNIYYCCNNIIIDNGKIIRCYQDKEKYLFVDYFILDLVNKKIIKYDDCLIDSFKDGLSNILKIDIKRNKEDFLKTVRISFEDKSDVIIKLDKFNRIISYKDDNISHINDNFLHKNKCLEEIDMPNVVSIDNGFLYLNIMLKKIIMNKLIYVGNGFLFKNEFLSEASFMNLHNVGDKFLSLNNSLEWISFPNLYRCNNDFLTKCKSLKIIDAPYLFSVGDNFLRWNKGCSEIYFPNLDFVGDNFMSANDNAEYLFMPALNKTGNNFLYLNKNITSLCLDNLEVVGDNFLRCDKLLNKASFNSLKEVGKRFLYDNEMLSEIYIPNLSKYGDNFLNNNPNCKIVRDCNVKKRVLYKI